MFKRVGSRCDHIALEHEILKFWNESEAFDKLRRKNAGNKPWSFLDGPITANNPMGVHHAWGRSLKDCYQRYHAMLGCDQRYQNGFDCQGLWVEVEVEKEMGYQTKADIERAGLENFINHCKQRVYKYSDVQTQQSIRLGYWMDWENSYYTMSDENNYTIWSFLKKCHQRGLVYKGIDAMPWCPRCETGISEQERREGYKTVEDTAVFVALPIVGRDNEYLMVWTTTPWTLAANVACAVNPEMDYIQVSQHGKKLYLAKAAEPILKERGEYTVEKSLKGAELVGLEYEGPFDELEIVKKTFAEKDYKHRVIEWEDITESEGVGIVHIAPGCGKEDFDLGKKLDLPILMPLDETGIYLSGYGELTGQKASEVAEQVLTSLREKGVYYKKETYGHEYPHCWRCATPLVFRAVDEWYINMDWRDEIMKSAKQVRWIPEWGLDQELNWLENMGDWMISKKRFWGLALPIFECKQCGTFEVIGSKEELKEKAVQGWDEFEGNSPHRPWVDKIRIKCQDCGELVGRIPDVGNPWLDAGIVPYSTVKYNTDKQYWQKWIPADLVLECFPGQFRNWFYAMLAMSTMMEATAPFKTLLGHALVRDEHGKEMHKSTGNAIWFDEAVEIMGADVMRWIYCRQNPTNNLNFGYHVGEQVQRRVFGTWWNVYSFFVNYARLDGFDPKAQQVPYEKLQDIDRWLLSKLCELTKAANESLEGLNVGSLVKQAEDFIEQLSNWYVRRNRRRFWRPKSESDEDKRAAYQTLYRVLVDLAKLMAPVIPFTTESMYQNLVRSADPDAPESVHHCDYPQFDDSLHNPQIAEQMDLVADIVSRTLNIRETNQIRVRQPLSRIIVAAEQQTKQALQKFESHILEEVNIKTLEIVDSLDEFIEYEIKPNFKTLGPKFGQEVKKVIAAVNKQPAAELAHTVEAGKPLTIEQDGQSYELTTEDVTVVKHFPENLEASEAVSPPLLVDTTITEELELEGLARDIVRHVQQLRKESDLEIQDRINLCFDDGDTILSKAIDTHADYIRKETLCDQIRQTDLAADQAKEIKIAKQPIKIKVEKL